MKTIPNYSLLNNHRNSIIRNAKANGFSGSMLDRLIEFNFDPGCLRPWRSPHDNRTYVTLNAGDKKQEVNIPVNNVTTTLRKNDWIELDRAIVKAAKERLRLVADLRGSGLTYNIPNGMGKSVLETERQSDISEATMSMDGLRKGNADRPVFDLQGLPLPILHKDFDFSARQVMTSRNGGSPLDTTTAELASRRVAELAENLTLGNEDAFEYAGGSIYGLTNFPQRITRTMTDPTASAWTPHDTVTEIRRMKQASYAAKHYGPFVLYTSLPWDEYLDEDYSLAGGNNPNTTLRNRILQIRDIQDVVTLDYLSGYQMLLVQQTTDVIRMVIGLDFTTIAWQEEGGMRLNFKVMAILVPQLRADINDNTGIVHGASSLSDSA